VTKQSVGVERRIPADLERAIGRLVVDDDEMLTEQDVDLLCQFDVHLCNEKSHDKNYDMCTFHRPFLPDQPHIHYFFASQAIGGLTAWEWPVVGP
jgi:hypothetical protein